MTEKKMDFTLTLFIPISTNLIFITLYSYTRNINKTFIGMFKDLGADTSATITTLKFLYYFSVIGLVLSLILSILWLIFTFISKRQKYILSTRKASIAILSIWTTGLFLNMVIPSLVLSPMFNIVNMIK